MLMMTRAIRIQSQTGGNLGRVLDTLAETITQRRRIDRKVKALTSEARASSIVITILPLFVAGFILATQPNLRDALLGTTFGRLVMLLVAALLFVGQLRDAQHGGGGRMSPVMLFGLIVLLCVAGFFAYMLLQSSRGDVFRKLSELNLQARDRTGGTRSAIIACSTTARSGRCTGNSKKPAGTTSRRFSS